MPTPETSAEKIPFDVDKAYNSKGFLEFLAQHPDAEVFDSKDAAAVEDRFETFETQAAVSRGVFEALNGHIKKELGIEIDSAEARESIEAYVMAKAVESPAEVAKMRDALDSSAALKAEISRLDGELGRAGRSADHAVAFDAGMDRIKDLHDVQESKKAVGGLSYLFKRIGAKFMPNAEFAKSAKAVGEARARVEAAHGKMSFSKGEELLAETTKQVGEIKAKLDAAKSIEDKLAIAARDFGELRNRILGSVQDSEELSGVLQDAVAARFKEITSKSSLQDLIKAQERLEALTDDNATGIDLFDGKSSQEIQDLIDERIEKKSFEMVNEALKGLDISGGRALDRLRKDLAALMSAEQLGSKQGEEAKEAVRKALLDAADSLKKASPENTAKRLVVRRIIDTL